MKRAREEDGGLEPPQSILVELLPELWSVIRTDFLPSHARIQMQRVCKRWWEEDKGFVAPACIIPPAPLAVKRHPDIRNALLALMEPCNTVCLQWIRSLGGDNRTVAYSFLQGWEWRLDLSRGESVCYLSYCDRLWKIYSTFAGGIINQGSTLEEVWKEAGNELIDWANRRLFSAKPSSLSLSYQITL